MAGLLLAFAAPRITAGEAAAITVLFRVATLWFAVFLGLIAALAWRARRARRVDDPTRTSTQPVSAPAPSGRV